MIIPLCALGFLVWIDGIRIRRVEYVSGLARDELKVDAASPTGYAGGLRQLIVPEHNNDSYGWIAQTQDMLNRREWRVRYIDYENAPFGREVQSASPYRWWLGLVAWLDHVFSGRPAGLSVERAALFADPLLHLLLLAGATIFVARQFGPFPAMLLSIGMATVFPFAAGFLPGAPDDNGLVQVCVLWSVLPLLAGIAALYAAAPRAGGEAAAIDMTRANARARRWFFAAGVAGGFGLWVGVSSQAPIIAGIALGAMMAAWIARGTAYSAWIEAPALWRAWALGGAATVLAGYLFEYFPAHLGSWELRVIHPLFGVAWLGGGELLARAADWIQREKIAWKLRDIAAMTFAAAGVASVPVAMKLAHSQGLMTIDLLSFRLTNQPDGIMAPHFAGWISRDGFTAAVWATVLPLLGIGSAVWLIARRRADAAHRMALAVALAPALVALGFACFQLRWWRTMDGMLLAVLVAATAAVCGTDASRLRRRLWSGCVTLILLPGMIQLLPRAQGRVKDELTVLEVHGLIERDLAYWLAKHANTAKPVVMAPPSLTKALHYYGGLRGVATLDWENQDGLKVALRVVVSNSAEQSEVLIRQRGVAYIILPSWDAFFEDFALGSANPQAELFITSLHRWSLPPWLRPVPYPFPKIRGFEGGSAVVIEVVDEQDEAAGLSRLAEYFVEMGQLDFASSTGQALRRFPANLSAMVARAQIENSLNDVAAHDRTLESILLSVSNGRDRFMPWDRRVSLAVVLARAKKMDLARAQVERCLAEIDEKRIRSLTTGALYHLQVLNRMLGQEIADQRLRELALDLLPPDLRERL